MERDINRPATWLWVWAAATALLLLAPTLVVVPLSFAGEASFVMPPKSWSLRWYEEFFTNPRWRDALSASLRVALLTTVTATALGTAAAYGLARLRGRAAALLSGLLLSPLIMPQIVTAVAVLAVYLRWQLNGTMAGFVAAHTMLAMPYVVVTVRAALSDYDRSLDLAASSLGAGPWTRFRTVTLPLLARGIVSGAVFAFVISLDDVVIALYLQTPLLRTLPVQMYDSITVDVDPTIAAAATLILAVTTAVLLLPSLIRSKKLKKVSVP
ncbi:ABC transporter permease [Microtetraspora sp. NBRC 16547]|uniref:ABC transporter permease n=1 Tax=Microtetraspora sp. NBRC 16547 TaxID=3030993 RepID=UPI0024A49F65|nr:ABC transporter permease [Microtetraspora sp. NBRC 16547]GLW96899.1 polyamine ABC transporter permease [Microtetraspora sp. NBRC 16547]